MNSKKRYIHIPVEDEAFEEFMKNCNVNGNSFEEEFLAMLVVRSEQILTSPEGEKDGPFRKIWVHGQRAKRFQIQLETVKNIGYQYKAVGSDDLLETFVELCDSIGVDSNDVLDDLSSNDRVIQYAAEHGLLNKTEQFLAVNVPREIGIPARAIKERAMSTLGVSGMTVDRAKLKMGILSKKVGTMWIWYWPNKEDDLEAEVEEILGED